MKNNYKKILISTILITVYSILFWIVYFNNIYSSINILRDLYYFNSINIKIITPIILILTMFSFPFIILILINKKHFWFILYMFFINFVLMQYPLYYYKIESNTKLNQNLYYKFNERFPNKESILNINSYRKDEIKYILTLDVFKSKSNLILLEEFLQSIYIGKKVRHYENIGNNIDMEKIYTLTSLKSELDLSIKLKECENIKNNDIFYSCTKYNIPSKIKYKFYLNNLNFTGILNENLWNSEIYQSFILNNFIHYNESLSKVDLSIMTSDEKNKDYIYREKIKKLLLKIQKPENITILKVIENNIIIKNRFPSQIEIFKTPEANLIS